MRCKILLIAVFLLLTLLTSVWAADILGNWIAKVPERQGALETIFNFKVNGTELTGTVTNVQGETAIREGKINGDEISFVVTRSVGGNERKLGYKGQVSLNEIRFTLEVQGPEGQPIEFIAKREFQRHGDIPLQRAVPIEPPPHKHSGSVPVEPPQPPKR